MPTPRTVLVVGASLSGHSAARALRTEGYDGRIVMIGDESHRPYDRPPLSKGFLTGTTTLEDLWLEGEDDEIGAEWLLGTRATALDPATRTVRLSDGGSLAGDAVVVATGSRARRLPTALGGDLAGVHTVRTLDDAASLRTELVPGARLVLVGAGFVGAEIAATASRLGLDVTLVEASLTPLAAQLGPELGSVVARLHASHGVPLLCGTPVAELTGTGRVDGVRLADGRSLPADVVVVGIGSVAAVAWLAGSGLSIDGGPAGGLACNATGATGAPGVFGVGDCSAWFDPVVGAHRRVEHWTDSHDRPRHAVRTLLGLTDPQASPVLAAPYFWSDQYDVRIQFAGRRFGDESVTIEAGSPETRDVLAVYRRGDVATAVLAMNQPRLFGRVRRSLAVSPVAA